MDRVEAAFSKFDTDGNGYIDWEEFKEVIFCLNSSLFKVTSDKGANRTEVPKVLNKVALLSVRYVK